MHFFFFFSRILLQYFNKALPCEAGGHENCCDNCYRKCAFCVCRFFYSFYELFCLRLHKITSNIQSSPKDYSDETKLLLGVIKVQFHVIAYFSTCSVS